MHAQVIYFIGKNIKHLGKIVINECKCKCGECKCKKYFSIEKYLFCSKRSQMNSIQKN